MTTLVASDVTVGELAVQNPKAVRIFERWQIDYCCGGQTPLADACAAAGYTVEEFDAALAAAADAPQSLAHDWQTLTLRAISTHLIDAYHRYTREELDALRPLADKVLSVHGVRRPELARVVTLIAELRADMLPHMLKEEQVLFPHVEELEICSDEGTPPPVAMFGTVKNPVRMMMLEHDRVGELLAKLRSLTSGYDAPADACFSYRELYRRLAELEARTHEHIHIENNVYFPRAVSLEEATRN